MTPISPIKRAAKSALLAVTLRRLPCLEPTVIDRIGHDLKAFTQGLAYFEGHLYESTGGETTSTLRRLNTTDGSIQALLPIVGDYAEGIAIFDNRLFQLSWKSGVAREYQLPDLKMVEKHRYDGEGWGLASDQNRLIASDGSSQLRFFDAGFQNLGTLKIKSNGIPIRWINDLECAGNRIYANIVASNFILEIDSTTGHAQRIIDCGQLAALESPPNPHSIMNGIAYCPEKNLFYVTGKNWRSLYLISIPN